MNEEQFNQLKQILLSSNNWHKITYEKLELLSLVLLQVFVRVMPLLDGLKKEDANMPVVQSNASDELLKKLYGILNET